MLRLRAIAFAAISTLTLLVATPGSAHATVGTFTYSYVDSAGNTLRDRLEDPKSNVCHNIEQADDPDAEKPAHSPYNRTDDKAYVYAEPDCEGTEYVLAKEVGEGGAGMEFRSVIFMS
ncbi:hypothetical protein [Streptomyces sp. NPDC058683]|uniref:hypothetical protein n=1 Tax=Streptomyces sp. NPDC058683 TaxID=3346597 RepID=UPI00364C698A